MSGIMVVADCAPRNESTLPSPYMGFPVTASKADLISSDTTAHLLPVDLALPRDDVAHDSEGSEHSSEFVLDPNDEACRQDGSITRHNTSTDGDDDSDEDFPPIPQEEIRQLLQQDLEAMAILTGGHTDSQEHPSSQEAITSHHFDEQSLPDLRPCYARELRRLDGLRFMGDLPKPQEIPQRKKKQWQEYQVGYYDPDSDSGCSSHLPFEQRMTELSAADVDLNTSAPEALSWDDMWTRFCGATS